MTIYGARDALLAAQSPIAFTGAGVSVASGIPDFRSTDGLWNRVPVEEFGTLDAYERDPQRFWSFHGPIALDMARAQPNPAHLALAELERLKGSLPLITQNIDQLHTRAGNTDVIELHGSLGRLRCLSCNTPHPETTPGLPEPCPSCQRLLKPDVVLFGEALPHHAWDRAAHLAETCDLCLVVGTSAVVYPAASIPERVHERGGTVLQFNLESTDLNHAGWVNHYVEGPAELTLPRLVSLLRDELPPV